MKEVFLRTKAAWKSAFSESSFRWQFFLTFLVFIVVSEHNFYCLNLWETTREGVRLNDIILHTFPPRDYSNIIFFFTYSSILFVMVSSVTNPGRLVRGFQAYTLIIFLRTVSIYLFPMEAPAGMIYLQDPVIDFFLNKQTFVTKDLFFSGHTATLAFMFFMAQNRYLKMFCLAALIIAPSLLVLQHVHYTVDVLCAPVVSYLCIKAVDWVNQHTESGKVLFKY